MVVVLEGESDFLADWGVGDGVVVVVVVALLGSSGLRRDAAGGGVAGFPIWI